MKKKVIKCVKGFDKDLKCMGFQYEIGKEYETDSIEMCKKGFHAIDESKSPLSVFKYYPPCDVYGNPNRFCLVELSGETIKEGIKTVGSKIKIVKEISIEGVVELQNTWSKKKLIENHSNDNANLYVSSLNGNTGDCSSASNTGCCSSAANTGNYSLASNNGHRSLAGSTGNYSLAANTGRSSSASNTGICSIAINNGNYSVATNVGNCSSTINNGYGSSANNTGKCSSAINKGNCSSATNTGDESFAEASGKSSIAAVFGKDCKVKGAVGCALFLTERGDWDDYIEGYPIKNVMAVMVDGVKVKADTFYMLVDGKLTECED